MSNKRWWTWITALTVAGLVVRVVYILAFRDDYIDNLLPNGKPYVTRVWGDGLVYHKQANLLVEGEGLIAPLPFELRGVVQEAADHPPLYVLYLAFFSLLGLKGDLTHMLVSAPLGALTALTFGLLARRVWSPRAGIIAAAIGAFGPSLVHYPGFILSETLTLPLVALFGLFIYRLWDEPNWKDAAWAGLFCGLATLSRPDVAMLVPFTIIPMIAILRRTDWRTKFGYLVAAGVACGVVVLPWVGYNLARYEKTVTLSVGLDYSMAQGNCDQTYYGEHLGYYWLGCMGERLEGTGLELVDQSLGAAHLREQTLQYMRDHASRVPVVVAARVGRLLGVFRPIQQAELEWFTEGREPWLSNLAVLSWYPMAALTAVGTVLLRRRGRPVFPMLALVAAAVVGVALTLAVLRYRVTMEPALAVLSAVSIDSFLSWIGRAWRET